MSRRAAIAIAALVAAAAAWWAWPTEEGRVMARLDEATSAASAPPVESDLERLTRLASLARTLDPDLVLDAGNGRPPVAGRDAVLALASSPAAGSVEIGLDDVRIQVAADRGAASVTAVVRIRERSRPHEQFDGQEVRIDLRKVDGVWLIARIARIAALSRPE